MGKVYKRSLTSAQSLACECAQKPRCTCRCGGLLHGVNHVQFQQIEASILRRDGQVTEEQVQDIVQFLKDGA